MVTLDVGRTSSSSIEAILALLSGHCDTCSRKHLKCGGFRRVTQSRQRGVPERRAVAATDASAGSTTFNTDQGPGPGPIGPGPGCNLLPAPASVGAAVNLSYFGPPPSESNPSLVGPVQLLKSGTVDVAKGTITLPLYQGSLAGGKKTVWYILTDVDDQGVATLLGLNYSAKLSYAANGARTANLDENGNLVFDKGTVDFSPVRSIVPGPPGAEFPPQSAQPGAGWHPDDCDRL